MKFGIAVV